MADVMSSEDVRWRRVSLQFKVTGVLRNREVWMHRHTGGGRVKMGRAQSDAAAS
jgi:hypothetical protein